MPPTFAARLEMHSSGTFAAHLLKRNYSGVFEAVEQNTQDRSVQAESFLTALDQGLAAGVFPLPVHRLNAGSLRPAERKATEIRTTGGGLSGLLRRAQCLEASVQQQVVDDLQTARNNEWCSR